MKKIVFLGILIFLVSIGIGFFYGRIIVEDRKENIIEQEILSVENIVERNTAEVEEAVSTELKVKPNMEFGIKEYFDECRTF